MINTYYCHRGGECTYTLNLSKLLRSKGHDVIPFAMHYPRNFESKYSKYFVSEINWEREYQKRTIASRLKVAYRFIYSLEAKRKIKRLIQAEKPDIAHLQCIHGYITPSILSVLKSNNVPIVWTLHDYKTICPNSTFLSHDAVCEACKNGRFFMAALKKCKRGSFLGSFLVSVETYTHRIMRLYRHVDKYIVPSRFLRDKLNEYGFGQGRTIYIPHFLFLDDFEPNFTPGNYFLFFARLDSHKGVMALLRAMKEIQGMSLKIAGEGEQRQELEAFVRKQGLKNVEFLGFKTGEELSSLIKNAAFVIFPSIWYENAPFSILESFSYGKPVIGSNLGGISELISNEETGLLFEPGNPEDLSKKIQFFISNPKRIIEMGINARKKAEEKFSPEPHYQSIMDVYNEVLT